MMQEGPLKHRITFFTILLLLSGALNFALFAAEQDQKEPAKEKASPREFVSQHKLTIGKEIWNYKTVAGDIIVEDGEGVQKAAIFSISYLLENTRPDRPITFLFNGGPGSSAVWLHLGAFGPKRIGFSNDPLDFGAPPYPLADNPYTLLRYTDLVFVDPVGTGYSRALGKNKDKDFWGVDEDSAILADYVRKYLTLNQRWNSPKYLAGESYGTIRASVMMRDLQLKFLDSIAFNGVILISAAMDVRTFLSGGPGNELPYIVTLPTFAATAFYHKALPEQPADQQTFLQEVETFASTEYLVALHKGDALPADQVKSIAGKLHRFTGLDANYIERSRLRITQERFTKELLRSRGQTIGVHDTRFLGKDRDDAGEFVQLDPFLFGVTGPFVTAINNYLSTDLKVKLYEPYKVFSLDAASGWKRAENETNAFAGFLNTTQYLQQSSAINKDFRVFAASGLHDLTTVYYGTSYLFDHSGIPKERVVQKTYPGGHMMYLYLPSLQQLSEDIGAFIEKR